MTEELYRAGVLALWIGAAISLPALFFLTAPYGRHTRAGWGPTLPARLGWIVMELPAPLTFLAVYLQGRNASEAIPLLFLALFQLHYVQRTVVFPLLMKGDKRNPVATVLMAATFNVINGSLNGYAVSQFEDYSDAAVAGVALPVGLLLFGVGMAINLHSDAVLRGLRKPGESGYRIPHGGLYRWVSCPNYLGEIVEWLGWALATGSAAGLAFAIFTIANLAPRAHANHRWYREQFPDYPKGRKALLPGLW